MRGCGILLHISSLPSDYGVGTLGKEAYRFVDFLKKGGQTYWQLLPIGPTGYGDSPYQSYSAYAGNPLFIDLDALVQDGLLPDSGADLKLLKKKTRKKTYKNYEQLYLSKKPILLKAATEFFSTANVGTREEFEAFCTASKAWLDDYALFTSLKDRFGGGIWTYWEAAIRQRDPDAVALWKETLAKEISTQKFIQYAFFKQYFSLKRYANENGVKLFGDMPIYVSADSADIWSEQKLFMLGDDGKPLKVAGCPPDDFSPTGQLWGNPLYDWDVLEKDNYLWWRKRIKYASTLFDLTRIDHFRGFESFYAISAEDKTAEHGEWLPGPGMKLFDAIKAEQGDIPLVAEDLGFLTSEVKAMLKAAGYPGMNVLQFAFGGDDSAYLPHNYARNSVAYIGTHDNDTALGWYASADRTTRRRINNYLGIDSKAYGAVEKMIRSLYASASELVILQMQDLLLQGSKARMNTPSTVGSHNWTYRLGKGDINDRLAFEIRKFADVYFRAPINNTANC
jgi:4-alpha-glucanotransferase